MTAVNPKWLLVDVYIDIASSKTSSSRKEFSRMLKDCQSRDIEIILTKSISRLGRDTVETLSALNKLKAAEVRIIFEEENLDTDEVDSNLMILVMESFARLKMRAGHNIINVVLDYLSVGINPDKATICVQSWYSPIWMHSVLTIILENIFHSYFMIYEWTI